ncbi:hypothetical protein [Natronoglomus mannanivorans]|uniref:Uncharacterized protein n=1 Tax=Natronoglomus mannanivorans TaxID=2979990 RepID=A0AAP2Z1L1_9EURY|nr:hypothetical protein [Halobacteria archaeon AArc-xg1-1]
MNVRDALEADADALAAIADSPTDVMRNLVHDRTVRVAEAGGHDPNLDADVADSGSASTSDSDSDSDSETRPKPKTATETDPNADGSSVQYGGSDPDDLLGFVSFDARDQTVHVTQIDGTSDIYEQLLAEPVRFATRESMAVEVLVPQDEPSLESAAEQLGFDDRGSGPRFNGRQTVRFRLEP